MVWAGLYWAWAGGGSQTAIGLRGPGGNDQQVTGQAAGAYVDLGPAGLPGIPVYQAFANVTGLVARYGAGAWSAAGWPDERDDGAEGDLGWTLVVVTADSAAPSGQVMVLDGARPVDAADPGFSAPLGGLLAGQAVRVHVVAWTERGPQASAFTQPLAGRPTVSFAAAAEPYLVGVITATESLAAGFCVSPVTRVTGVCGVANVL